MSDFCINLKNLSEAIISATQIKLILEELFEISTNLSVILFLASYILGLIKSEVKKSKSENESDFCINLTNQSDARISATQLKLFLVELFELSPNMSVI